MRFGVQTIISGEVFRHERKNDNFRFYSQDCGESKKKNHKFNLQFLIETHTPNIFLKKEEKKQQNTVILNKKS